MSVRRTTISFPEEVLGDIEYLARRLRISKSSLISGLLAEALADMRRMVEAVPEDTSQMTEAEALRWRGESAKVIEQRLENLRGMRDDLFSK